jgi:D-alanyl-D-alanine endopeptidase (penicillin-binding protein 7)
MKHLLFTFSLLVCGNSFAGSQFVLNVSKNEVVLDSKAEAVRPIASVTKLMTALVLLDSNVSMEEKVPYKGSKSIPAKPRTRDELLSLMLIKSDNNAAEALARSHPGGREVFIQQMNKKASSIGMELTTYEDPSGLGINNQSTARDLSTLLKHSYNYAKIRQVASTTSYTVVEPVSARKSNSKKKKKQAYGGYRAIHVNNTNFRLLNEYEEIEISKTGFTNPAGKCLAMMVNKHGENFAVIILGERDMRAVEKVSRKIINSL